MWQKTESERKKERRKKERKKERNNIDLKITQVWL
jgi:hypothetical protein